MKHMLEVPKAIWRNKKLLLQLSKNDFKTKFAGSMFGRIWGFIQPLVMILVYWFAFEKGIKIGTTTSATGMQVPFLLWLIAGLVPWFFFSDALSGGVNALTEYSYLVKKVVFEISILPLVKIISAMFTHVFFLLIVIVLYSGYGFSFDVYVLFRFLIKASWNRCFASDLLFFICYVCVVRRIGISQLCNCCVFQGLESSNWNCSSSRYMDDSGYVANGGD